MGIDPEVLILGSMPSERSLKVLQYYAHPQNAFWWIMSHLEGFPLELSYEDKCSQLKLSNYAVWDVLHSCKREGSLDCNIERTSEKVNDFSVFLNEHKSIKLIAFNGGAARQIFMRHCVQIMNQHNYIKLIQLPSTSPAHARVNRQQKLQLWRNGLVVN